ncbi:hypothetical protein BKA62DRAFT_765100 [Auriculariales sp. MPI-PUGE-AT-0066]|nr:hypothetical protein BKA62DRAFT_765100 [Auriculariales sp. MPI-PUGE-AT-0066]
MPPQSPCNQLLLQPVVPAFVLIRPQTGGWAHGKTTLAISRDSQALLGPSQSGTLFSSSCCLICLGHRVDDDEPAPSCKPPPTLFSAFFIERVHSFPPHRTPFCVGDPSHSLLPLARNTMHHAASYVPIIRLRQDDVDTTPPSTDPNSPPESGGDDDGNNGGGGTDGPSETPTSTDAPTSTTTTTTTTESSTKSTSTSTSTSSSRTSSTKPDGKPDGPTSSPSSTKTNTGTNTDTDTGTGSQTSGPSSDPNVTPAGPSSTTPIPPVPSAGESTQTAVVPNNSYAGSIGGGNENGQFATDTSVPTSAAAAKSSGGSKVLPILLPCLLIPIALIAVLILVVRRRRQQHAALLDDFTQRSTFYSGAGFGIGAEHEKNAVALSSTAHLNRSPSLSSSRYGAAYGVPHSPSGTGSHLDHSMPPISPSQMALYANANPSFNVVPPTPRSTHNRTPSDDLDIKCAGRGVSTGSFSALYDDYGRDSRAGGEGVDDTMLAYDRPGSVTTPMPEHPYSPTATANQGQFQQQQQYAYQGSNQYPPQQQQYYDQYQYQYQPQPQPQPQPPVQVFLPPHPVSAQHAPAQSSNFFKRPQFLGGAASQPASNNPFTRNVTPPQQQAYSNQSAHKPSASQSTASLTTASTGAPQLQLPTFTFDFNNGSEASSPISAVFRTDDPFADPTNGAGAARIGVPTSSSTVSPLARAATAGYASHAGNSDVESVKASAFPNPPSRVSAERRAARTRSVEQRLVMAMAINDSNGAHLQ